MGWLLGGPSGIQLSLTGSVLPPASWFGGLLGGSEGESPSTGFLLWWLSFDFYCDLRFSLLFYCWDVRCVDQAIDE